MKQVVKRNTFYKDGIRFECQGSGRCCRARGKYGYVYLTYTDRKRLAHHLEILPCEFTKQYTEKIDGVFHLKNPEKDCLFLEKNSCTVYEARPQQCRTWPFWPENMKKKVWQNEIAPYCPGIGKGRFYTVEEIEGILDKGKRETGDDTIHSKI